MASMTEEKHRTIKQNKAMHLMFKHLADTLNESGLDMKKTLRKDVEILWTPYMIKEYIWRRVMKAQTGKTSTTELTTKEINEVFETISRHMASIHGLVIGFPSIQSLTMDDRIK